MKTTTYHRLGIAVTLVSLVLFFPHKAFSEGYAGYAGAFLRMGAGPATLAAGDAGVARATGTEQAHYNPAGLPFAPGNEVWVAWHKLSLDRTLAHVGALYQVPRISLWSGPVQPVVLLKNRSNGKLRLVYPRETRYRGLRTLRPEDYLSSLADAALALAGRGNPSPNLPLMFPEGAVDAGSLTPLLTEASQLVRQRGLQDRDEVVAALRNRYLRVQKHPAAVALTWTHAGVDNIDSRDFDGNVIGSLGWFENRFSLSFGLRLHRKVSVGFSAGVLYALIPGALESGSLTSTTFIADAGVQVRPFADEQVPGRLETLTLGAAAYGIGAKNSWNTTGYWSQGTTRDDPYPERYRFGAAWAPIQGVALFSDVETDLQQLAQLKSGLELTLIEPYNSGTPGLFGLAGGSMPGVYLRAGLDRDRPTFGLGLELRLADLGTTRLDYAFVSENVSPEPTQVVSWRFQLMR